MPDIEATAQRIESELARIGREAQAAATENFRAMQAFQAATEDKLTARLAAVEQASQDNIDQVGVMLNRRFTGAIETKSMPEQTFESKAFESYLRRGVEGLLPDERKALTVGNDTSGGYTAPPQFIAELQRTMRAAGVIQRLSRNMKVDRGELELPSQVGHTAATWVGEVEARPETTVEFASTTIVLNELACFVDVSLKLLDDSAIDIPQLLATDLGESFAAAFETAALTGNGIKKPKGILNGTDYSKLTVVHSGHATQPTADSLVVVPHSINPLHRQSGVWLMSNATASIVRQMKDSSGRFLWADTPMGLTVGTPSSLLGHPVEISDGMPAVAAGSYPILFGDFARSVWTITKPTSGLSVLVDPFTTRGWGTQRYHARMRIGSAHVRAGALAALRISV